MDRISLRGNLISKNHVLENPEAYRDRPIMIFELSNNDYYEAARNFHREWNGKMDNLILALGFQPVKFEERAKKLFFAVRDRLAETSGDTTRANKDSIYHGLILDCDFRTIDGRQIEHISDLTKRQLWELVQRAMRELEDTEESYEFYPLRNDLYRDLGGK